MVILHGGNQASSLTLELTTEEGDYRKDEKRRLPKGHAGELSSRLLVVLDEDLDDMLASSAEGNSGCAILDFAFNDFSS